MLISMLCNCYQRYTRGVYVHWLSADKGIHCVSTFILLILVPCLYLGMENMRERLSAPRRPELDTKEGAT